MLWTEGGIRKVATDVVSGDAGKESTRKHVAALFQEQIATQLGDQLRQLREELRVTAEQIAKDSKATLQRKLNSIYAAHAERLKGRITELERQLEANTPDYHKKLEQFEEKLQEVAVSYRARLDEPERDLADMISQHKNKFLKDLKRISTKLQAEMQEAILNAEISASDRLHALILEAVREHVRSAPFEQDGLSNKQLAAAKGISLRAAKRLRRSLHSADPGIVRR